MHRLPASRTTPRPATNVPTGPSGARRPEAAPRARRRPARGGAHPAASRRARDRRRQPGGRGRAGSGGPRWSSELLGGPRRWRRREVATRAGVSQLLLPQALARARVRERRGRRRRVHRRRRRSARPGRPARAVRPARRAHRDHARAGPRPDRGPARQLADRGPARAPRGAEGVRAPARRWHGSRDLAGDLEALLVYAWRRHLAATAAWLSDAADDGDLATAAALTVGFADLVSYTRLSQRLEQRELGVLVQRFEGLASDVVTAGGGRVVKTVGDEVLFTADAPAAAAVIALSLSEQMAVDDVVPDVRVGLAHGEVLRSLGDVYGPTVNLASRLTALAQPGTVVTDPGTGEILAEQPDLVLVPQRDAPGAGVRADAAPARRPGRPAAPAPRPRLT